MSWVTLDRICQEKADAEEDFRRELDDARRFADAASAAGTLVTLDIYQDMVHAFHLSALPEAPPQVAIMFLDRLTAWTTALPGAGIAREK